MRGGIPTTSSISLSEENLSTSVGFTHQGAGEISISWRMSRRHPHRCEEVSLRILKIRVHPRERDPLAAHTTTEFRSTSSMHRRRVATQVGTSCTPDERHISLLRQWFSLVSSGSALPYTAAGCAARKRLRSRVLTVFHAKRPSIATTLSSTSSKACRRATLPYRLCLMPPALT